MTSNIKHDHHKEIVKILSMLNSPFLDQEGIIFAGGTRIALELNEFRLSDDIDFFCINPEAFAVVREEIQSNGDMGKLGKGVLPLLREPRYTQLSIQMVIKTNKDPIKLEFIRSDDLSVTKSPIQTLPVPHTDRQTCYTNKLMALANRFNDEPYKDFFDLLAMKHTWGDIPYTSLTDAANHYRRIEFILKGMELSFNKLKSNPKAFSDAAKILKIEDEFAEILLGEIATNFQLEYLAINTLSKNKSLSKENLSSAITFMEQCNMNYQKTQQLVCRNITTDLDPINQIQLLRSYKSYVSDLEDLDLYTSRRFDP